MDRGKGESEKKPTEREDSEWTEREWGERERESDCVCERQGANKHEERGVRMDQTRTILAWQWWQPLYTPRRNIIFHFTFQDNGIEQRQSFWNTVTWRESNGSLHQNYNKLFKYNVY